MKSFSVGGARTLEVKLEAFHVPNRPNFAIPWGRITSTVTTSRQIQVGAKLTF